MRLLGFNFFVWGLNIKLMETGYSDFLQPLVWVGGCRRCRRFLRGLSCRPAPPLAGEVGARVPLPSTGIPSARSSSRDPILALMWIR